MTIKFFAMDDFSCCGILKRLQQIQQNMMAIEQECHTFAKELGDEHVISAVCMEGDEEAIWRDEIETLGMVDLYNGRNTIQQLIRARKVLLEELGD